MKIALQTIDLNLASINEVLNFLIILLIFTKHAKRLFKYTDFTGVTNLDIIVYKNKNIVRVSQAKLTDG